MTTRQEKEILLLKTQNMANTIWAGFLEIANPVGNAGLSFLGMYGLLGFLHQSLLEDKINKDDAHTLIIAISLWVAFCEGASTSITRSVDTYHKTLVENSARTERMKQLSEPTHAFEEEHTAWWKKAGKAIISVPGKLVKGAASFSKNFVKGTAEGGARIRDSFAETYTTFRRVNSWQKAVRIFTMFTPMGWLGFFNHLSKGLSEQAVAASIQLNSLIIFTNIAAGLNDMFKTLQTTTGTNKETQEDLSPFITIAVMFGALGVSVSYVPFTRRKGVENTRLLHNQITKPLSFEPFYASPKSYIEGQIYAAFAIALHMGSATFSFFTTAKGITVLGKLIHLPAPKALAEAVGVSSSILGVVTGHSTRVFSMLLSALNPSNPRAKIKMINGTGVSFNIGARIINGFNASAAASKNMLGTALFLLPIAPYEVTFALVGVTGLATTIVNLKFSGGDTKNRMTNWGNKVNCCGGQASTDEILTGLASSPARIQYLSPDVDPEQQVAALDQNNIVRAYGAIMGDQRQTETFLPPEGYEREPNSMTAIFSGPQ